MGTLTENTLNDFLAQYLRERWLSTYTELSGKTAYGMNQPDFVVQNSDLVFWEEE
jgi:hypothetical protein